MTYSEALAYVSSLAPRGWRLGLDRMQEFARRAGLDQGGPRYIQIAGTNGKGSVTAFVQSLLIEQGYRAGAFFSPYVYDPRERVQFGRELISETDFASVVQALMPIAEGMEDSEFQGPTEFEFKTAVGVEYWRRRDCQWVSLEVGLGGRLDATSIVTPAAGVIVSIGLDHTSILGDTLELIAAEKAGIVKPGMPLVVGQMEPGPRAVIERIAREQGSEVWRFGTEIRVEELPDGLKVTTPVGSYSGLRPGLKGRIQHHNLALAIGALEAAGAIRDASMLPLGASRAFCPGRFEQRGRFVLDGAHNPQAARVLVKILRGEGFADKSLVLLTSMVNGHESEGFYRALAPMVREAHVGPIDFHRAQPAERVAEAARAAGIPATSYATLPEAIAAAERAAGEQTVLVSGSFYFLGDVGKLIG